MADVPMTRAEAVRLIEAHEHVVRRWAGAHHDKIEEAIDAQVQSRKALIDALTRPAPSQSDVEAVSVLIDACQIYHEAAPGRASADALNALDEAKRAVLARMRGAAVPECAQIPTPPEGTHYELVPNGETLSEITDQWGKTTKAMLLNKCDAVIAAKERDALREALEVLLSAVDAVNNGHGYPVVDPHSTQAARDALSVAPKKGEAS